MADDVDLSTFADYYRVADALVDRATKEELAEAGRLLAMHVAYYRERYGPVPDDQVYRCMTETEITDEDRKHLEASTMFFAETVALVIADRPEVTPSTH